jgi:hypothetical protein
MFDTSSILEMSGTVLFGAVILFFAASLVCGSWARWKV